VGWLGDEDSPLSGSVVEAAASAKLTERVFELIAVAVADTDAFAVTPALVCELHRIGAEGIVSAPGVYRDGQATIKFAGHTPPRYDLVPALVEEMCETINAEGRAALAAAFDASLEEEADAARELKGQWIEDALEIAASAAVHAAAYALWRLNWIHPFEDGNGRTSRALSYVVFSWATAVELPGRVTLPERIQRERNKYYRYLEAADEAWKNRKRRHNALQQLSGFLHRLVRAQLADRD